MIKKFADLLSAGLQQLWLNAHYLFVAFLLVVIPGLFVWIGQSFFDVAYQNVNRSEKEGVWLLHDSIELIFEETLNNTSTQNKVSAIVGEISKITKISIVERIDQQYLIKYSSDQEEVGMYAGLTVHEEAVMNHPEGTSVLDQTIDGVRTWKAYRQINFNGSEYFIFSEHSFAEIDRVMLARQQQVYMALSVIFLFLIALAYWFMRQTQWQREYATTKKKLDEQMLFTNTIAHELRAPLTAIRGYISFLLESKNLSSEEHKYTENINMSAERLLALINDFLEVARIQSGNLKIKFTDSDVRNVLTNVKTEFQQVAEDKNLKLDVNVPNQPVIAETDAERLQQVLTNLVSNALKYTEEGSVTLALEQTRLKTIVTIKDTGHGISAEDQQKLFKAFTRVGKADQGNVTGTGLGMWITKQLIELLHGTIAVESIEGVGTHVKITFDV